MSESYTPSVEAKINIFTGEVGIGVSLKRSQAVSAPGVSSGQLLSFLKPKRKDDEVNQMILDDIVGRAKEYPPIDVRDYEVGGYWRGISQQPAITAVVSGKGGVGKTSIALALAEYYSMEEKVLIVDFDLHNRGLTSKYGPMTPGRTTVLSEMNRFSTSVLSQVQRDVNGRLILSELDEKAFLDLRERYCYSTYPSAKELAFLKPEFLYQKSVREAVCYDRARPGNCYFLPSRRGGDLFLGTVESRFDVGEVALFLTFLASLAHRNSITRVILDCHGAHDLFMVGAIIASNDLIVVTRPEPAAFEGTIELVRFAQSIVESQAAFPSRRALVFNDYRESDRQVAETLYRALYQDSNNTTNFGDIPKIASSNELRDILKYYSEPCLLSSALMGPATRELCKLAT